MSMSNDRKVEELDKRIVKLPTSHTLPNRKRVEPDRAALLKLAKKIRKTVEDYTVENTIHTKSS